MREVVRGSSLPNNKSKAKTKEDDSSKDYNIIITY